MTTVTSVLCSSMTMSSRSLRPPHRCAHACHLGRPPGRGTTIPDHMHRQARRVNDERPQGRLGRRKEEGGREGDRDVQGRAARVLLYTGPFLGWMRTDMRTDSCACAGWIIPRAGIRARHARPRPAGALVEYGARRMCPPWSVKFIIRKTCKKWCEGFLFFSGLLWGLQNLRLEELVQEHADLVVERHDDGDVRHDTREPRRAALVESVDVRASARADNPSGPCPEARPNYQPQYPAPIPCPHPRAHIPCPNAPPSIPQIPGRPERAYPMKPFSR